MYIDGDIKYLFYYTCKACIFTILSLRNYYSDNYYKRMRFA